MKKLILLMMLVILTGISAMNADEYVPQVREGVEWGYINLEFGPAGNFEYYRLQFKGQTEINGKEYYNLYKYDTSSCSKIPMG